MLRVHEAAPPSSPGAAESLVSFIPLFGSPYVKNSRISFVGSKPNSA